MATIKTIYNDNSRQSVLEKCMNSAKSDNSKGGAYISEELQGRIEKHLPRFQEKNLALSALQSNRSKEIREKNLALENLEMIVRDGWEVIKRRIRRKQLPAEVLTYYQLPLSGVVPKHLKEKDLLSLSAKIIQGDNQAVDAGFEPMLDPSQAELNDALVLAKKEVSDVAPADREFDQAQEALEVERIKADELINDILAELKFQLRKKDPASQRRIIQSYGIEIIANKGEPESDSLDID